MEMDPRWLYENRRFLGLALDPPDFMPGSWIGAGKALLDPLGEDYLLTARPRKAADHARGYEAEIFRSADGCRFRKVSGISKAEASELGGLRIHSIEGTQLIRNPEDGVWHFFLSVDTGEGCAWGGIKWETLLLTSDSLTGPWTSEGKVLQNDHEFDASQARDATIDIVEGEWICIYKAKDAERHERPALATSRDGRNFQKAGPLTIDGEVQLAFLSGSIFPGHDGPLFLGLRSELSDSRSRKAGVVYADEHGVGHGGGPPSRFVACRLNIGARNLDTVFDRPWIPLSGFEDPEHPLLGYSSLLNDVATGRMLIYVEAIDPDLSRAIGLNETVERTLVYEARYDV